MAPALTLTRIGDAELGGETCPVIFDPASERAIALRAPLLSGATIEDARLDPGRLMTPEPKLSRN